MKAVTDAVSTRFQRGIQQDVSFRRTYSKSEEDYNRDAKSINTQAKDHGHL